jgi:DNA-binding beta-propeller fold protein YncE
MRKLLLTAALLSTAVIVAPFVVQAATNAPAKAKATVVKKTTAPKGEYQVLRVARVGGIGGSDYVYADVAGRRLYIARSGPMNNPRIDAFDLDTLQALGNIPNANAHGAAVDPKSGHGFATSKPVVMWDTKTLATIKTINVDGNPDGLLFEPYSGEVFIYSHAAPNITRIRASDGTVMGTIDLGGMPEQSQSDGKGHLYVDLEDKNQVAVVDTKTMQVTAKYDLGGSTAPAGLGFDAKNHILFVAARMPATMVILNADTGKILATLPTGTGTDGAGFNPNTMEAFTSQGDGTMTFVKEVSPTKFEVEQTLQLMPGARTSTLDTKTNRIFLIASEFGPAPAPVPGAAPGRGGGRGPAIPGSFSIIEVGRIAYK